MWPGVTHALNAVAEGLRLPLEFSTSSRTPLAPLPDDLSAEARAVLDEIADFFGRGQDLQAQPAGLSPGPGPPAGEAGGARLRIVELVGRLRRRLGRSDHVLDPAQRRRATR
jgi:hypothetical protein